MRFCNFIIGLLGFLTAIITLCILAFAIYDFIVTWQALNMETCLGIILFIFILISIIAMFIFSIGLMKNND